MFGNSGGGICGYLTSLRARARTAGKLEKVGRGQRTRITPKAVDLFQHMQACDPDSEEWSQFHGLLARRAWA